MSAVSSADGRPTDAAVAYAAVLQGRLDGILAALKEVYAGPLAALNETARASGVPSVAPETSPR